VQSYHPTPPQASAGVPRVGYALQHLDPLVLIVGDLEISMKEVS
jgi:hypothetical protein